MGSGVILLGWKALTPVKRSGSCLEEYLGFHVVVVDRMGVAKGTFPIFSPARSPAVGSGRLACDALLFHGFLSSEPLLFLDSGGQLCIDSCSLCLPAQGLGQCCILIGRRGGLYSKCSGFSRLFDSVGGHSGGFISSRFGGCGRCEGK